MERKIYLLTVVSIRYQCNGSTKSVDLVQNRQHRHLIKCNFFRHDIAELINVALDKSLSLTHSLHKIYPGCLWYKATLNIKLTFWNSLIIIVYESTNDLVLELHIKITGWQGYNILCHTLKYILLILIHWMFPSVTLK